MMKTEISVEELLRWRLAKAQAEAPLSPRAARLMEKIRPWWEKWPERFQRAAARLRQAEAVYGHAMAEPEYSRQGHPIPVLIVHELEEWEGSARVLYLRILDGRLRLRFQLLTAQAPVPPEFEVTIVSVPCARPLWVGPARLSVDNDYRVDAEFPDNLATDWAELKVTDRMPFRLILRTSEADR